LFLPGFTEIPVAIIIKFSRQNNKYSPTLLPKYGGKGMYGMNVHKAILK
jgi:phosphoribosylglycinamide formyltransferase-1